MHQINQAPILLIFHIPSPTPLISHKVYTFYHPNTSLVHTLLLAFTATVCVLRKAVPRLDYGGNLFSGCLSSKAPSRSPKALPWESYTPGTTLSLRCQHKCLLQVRPFLTTTCLSRHTPSLFNVFIPLVSYFSHCLSLLETILLIYLFTGLSPVFTLPWEQSPPLTCFPM